MGIVFVSQGDKASNPWAEFSARKISTYMYYAGTLKDTDIWF